MNEETKYNIYIGVGMRIALLDTIGLDYNGDTLKEKGLGGSESAIILLAVELVKIGFDVTVFNKHDKIDGTFYDGVKYVHIENLNDFLEDSYDILVSSRNAAVYAPLYWNDMCIENFQVNPAHYAELVNRSKYKTLWLHDTFCLADELVQILLADNLFDRIFTLSDWHSTYISTGPHCENERFPEFFKSRIFHTRNGAVNRNNYVALEDKDENLFVYNSSIPKGMVPLVKEVWPALKKKYPNAKLKVIGGYYDFKDPAPDSFEKQFMDLKAENDGKLDIEFTGIISQQEISSILKEATYFLYPGIYPETFGISVTEAMLNNVAVIGFNFGALEEISPNSVSYNSEFKFSTNSLEADLFADKIALAVEDTYLLQQKQNKCNEFKEFLGWDVVALQWKHHFYRVLDMNLPVGETVKHRYNMGNIYKMYGKQFVNPEEYTEDYSYYDVSPIAVVSPVYNAENYIKKHIESVAAQVYTKYVHIIIDDMSTDDTFRIAEETIASLDESVKGKFLLIKNTEKKYAVGNQVETILNLAYDPIVILLDGDDWLTNDPDIFNYINREYDANGVRFTYGSCHSLADGIDLIAQTYPPNVIQTKTFRWHKFNWGMPYTHLRTFKKSIFDKVDKKVFTDKNDEYWKAGGDNAMFYPLIEQCRPEEIKAIQRVLVVYNDMNPNNDYKVNAEDQNKTAEQILKET